MKIIQFLKSNILLVAGLMAIIFSLSFTYGNGEAEKIAKVDTTYFYISSDMSAGAFATPDSAHWNITNSNGECGEPDPIRPCKITVPAGSTLSSVLSGKNNIAVLAISQGYKSAP